VRINLLRMQEVCIVVVANNCEWLPATAQRYGAGLPPAFIQAAAGYVHWQDKQASLLGKIALQQGLIRLGLSPALLHNIRTDTYQRPYIPDGPDFNISHCKGLVVCALSRSGRVGIDVEALLPLEELYHKLVFTPAECRLIAAEASPEALFYHFWTRKEAVIKADGRGFSLSPATFEAVRDEVWVDNQCWFVQKIDVPPGFCCHLATETALSSSPSCVYL